MNTINTTTDFEITDELIAEMNDHHTEFVTARDKFIAGEISEAELGEQINLEIWKEGYISSAKKLLKEALEKLGFQDISYTRNGYITTEDRFDSVTPLQLTMLIYTHFKHSVIKQVQVKREHGRVRYNVILPDIKTIFAQIKAENDKDDEPLTADVELELRERNKDADLEMGRTYMYVFDAFHEVYGVYPELLSNHEDYVRLGRMMNLALIGERFDI